MIPLSSAISAGLTFSKVARSRIYELRLNNDVVGTLLRPSFWSMSYRAETQAGIWTFRRAGWLGGKSEVLDRSSQQPSQSLKSELRRSYSFGATYSFGFADPSPKKNCSICFTMTS